MYLSKSDFKVARTCPTKLYYKKLGYPSVNDEDEFLALLAEGGHIIGKIAQLLYPHGREISFEGNHQIAAQKTREALVDEHVTLFEATFISRHKLVRTDILIKHGQEIQLVEVKTKSYDGQEDAAARESDRTNIFNTTKGEIATDWRECLEDIAFQVLVLKELFPDAKINPFLLLPDKSKITQIDQLHSLFKITKIRNPDSGIDRLEVTFTGDEECLRQDHFLSLVSVSAEVEMLLPLVAARTQRLVNSLHPVLQKIGTPLSVNCRDCEFHANNKDMRDGYGECWGQLAEIESHLFDLYHIGSLGGRGGPTANRLIQQEKVSLFDLGESDLVDAQGEMGERNRRQIIQIEHTRTGTEWISQELAGILADFQYPLHFIDFETAAPAVPYHAGMHPYESVAFQWSCHTLPSREEPLEHTEWINSEQNFPNFKFAETLRQTIGGAGTIFMWAPHENTILRLISHQLKGRGVANGPLQAWLEEIANISPTKSGRLVDMNQLTLRHYFHPLMKGRTSIKNVADAIWKTDPSLRGQFPERFKIRENVILSPYECLPSIEIEGKSVVVDEGTGAIRAYENMLYGSGGNDAQIKECWKTVLLQYCELDTLSMVFVWKHWLQVIERLSP